ncbi:hypothetical protein NSQ77_17880 [Oceanobacillus sp. FSL K6-2867]
MGKQVKEKNNYYNGHEGLMVKVNAHGHRSSLGSHKLYKHSKI